MLAFLALKLQKLLYSSTVNGGKYVFKNYLIDMYGVQFLR